MSSFRKAACVVLLRKTNVPSNECYEIFLVQRNPELQFMGGFHVFPGGTVDAEDSQILLPGHPDDDLRVAAARELFEETGILAAHGHTLPNNEVRAQLREQLLSGSRPFKAILESHDLALNGDDFLEFGRWITPQFSPIRFDAVYFAVMLPENQTPSILQGELIDGFWCTPARALLGHQDGEYFITYPVLETLRALRDCNADLSQASHIMMNKKPDAYPTAGGEMIRGIHILPLSSTTKGPVDSTNTFILGEKEAVVVDPGTHTAEGCAALINYMKLMIRNGTTFRSIWLTHSRPDHIASAKKISIEFKLPILAHQECAKRLPKDIPIGGFLEDGDCFDLKLDENRSAQWKVFHTPGITPGHVVFYEENLNNLVSGNTVIAIGSPALKDNESNPAHLKSSLQRLEQLQLGIIFPGHGPSVAAGRQAIARMIEALD